MKLSVGSLFLLALYFTNNYIYIYLYVYIYFFSRPDCLPKTWGVNDLRGSSLKAIPTLQFCRAEYIAWCLRFRNRGMLIGPRIFGSCRAEDFICVRLPTRKWPCVIYRVSEMSVKYFYIYSLNENKSKIPKLVQWRTFRFLEILAASAQ